MNKIIEKDLIVFLINRESDIALDMEDFGYLKQPFNYFLGRKPNEVPVKVFPQAVTKHLKELGIL